MMKIAVKHILMLVLVASTLQVQAAKEMYARLTDSNKTMTFYYNNDYQAGSDMLVKPFANSGQRGWNSKAADITKVVIDASFADARPTSTAFWFYECTQLATIEGLRNVNTSEVTDMSFMFSGTIINEVSIGQFQTDKVTTMYCMFQGCGMLQTIDMTDMKVGPNLNNITKMFASCTSLTTIISDADFSGVAEGTDVFYRCFNLKGDNGTTYNASLTSKMYARPDKSSKPGYFTAPKAIDLGLCEASLDLSSVSLTYDGTAKKPAVTVTRKSDGSVVAADCYTVRYEDNVNASGNPKVILTGANDSRITLPFFISKVSLNVSVSNVEKTYGEDKTLSPVISYEGFVNNETVDVLTSKGQVFFEEEISQWTDAGTYKIYARYVRADNYEANYTDGTLTIHPKDIAGAAVTIADYDKTGHAIIPEATVELEGYGTLKYYRDYDITATNNVEPGTATATITGKGNYTGSVQQTFTINDTNPRVDLTDCEIVIDEHDPYVYDGQAKTPTIQVRRKSDSMLIPTTGYRVTYEDNVNASSRAKVVAWGRDDTYVVATFSIAKVNLKVSVTDVEKTYGEDKTLSPVISYEGFVNNETVDVLTSKGQVFFEEEISQWTKAGTYKIYARYVRATNYEADYTDGTLTIHPKDIAGAAVTIADYDKTGHAIIPEATVTLEGYGTLKYYRDYDITATNNVEPGTATATITGKGNYTGSVQQTFTINDTNPRVDLTDCEIVIDEHDPYVYDGQAKTPTIQVRRKSDNTVIPTTGYKVTYEDNVNAGSKAKVVAWGRDDTYVVATFSIAKVSLKVSVTDAEKTYGEDKTLSPVISYEGFVNNETVDVLTSKGQVFFEEEISQWTDAGTYKIYARYVRADNYEANYTDGTLTIHPKDIAGAAVTIADYDKTGHAIIPEATVTLEGYGTLKYYRDYDITATNNVEPGTATATITGKGNYTGSVQQTFTINDTNPRVDLTDCEIVIDEHDPYVYDGQAKTPTIQVRRKSDSMLIPTTGYRVTYEDNVNAGSKAKVVAWGRDDTYVMATFSIAKVSLKVSVTDAEKTYGEDKTLSPVISYEGFVNNETVDVLTSKGQVFFEEEITQWTKAGTYKIYARYVRATNYEADYQDGTLTIHPKDIAGAAVTIADYDKTGHAIIPEATVELEGYGTLKYYRDYDITATNNVEPGTATATITGKGNYTGSVQQTFTIKDLNSQVDLADCEIVIDEHDPYVYDGQAKTPTIKVRRKADKAIIPSSTYRVTYEDNVNAGSKAKVVAWGSDDTYVVATFSIAKVNLKVSVTDAEKTYGEDKTLSPVISYEGFVNNETVDVLTTQGQVFFEEEISQWTKAGTYKIYARYVRATNYEADYQDGTLTIHPKDIAGAAVTIADYDKTGHAIIPEATVELEGYGTLKYYRDYDITVTNNVEPGTATATITGKGNYTGSVQQTFTIKDLNSQVDLADCEIVIDEHDPYVYDGQAKTPTIKVRRKADKAIIPSSTYRVTYEDNVNAGSKAKVVAWGRDDTYVVATFSIAKVNLKVSVTDAEKTYGEDKTLSPVISYEGFVNNETVDVLTTQGQVFFEEEITQWTKAGTYKIYARYVRATNYEADYQDGTLTIHPKDISAAQVTIGDYTENGYPIVPEAKVTLLNYGELKYYRDYDITATNNVEPGTATATITGKGNYTGTIEKTFTIKEASKLVDIRNCELVLVDSTKYYYYDGKPKEPEVFVRRKSDGSILDKECYTIAYEDNVNASGKPRVIAYGAYDTQLSLRFTINKAKLLVSVTDIEKTYGEDVELTSGIGYYGFQNQETLDVLTNKGQVFFEEEITQWTKAGTYKVYARYVRADNYEADYKDGTLTIHPKDIADADVSIREYKYSGHPIVPEATVTLEGYGELKYYRDYEITAVKNVEPGWAIATITGKGNYTGSIQQEFLISMTGTGIAEIDGDDDTSDKWYDMRGRRIAKPTTKGLYIKNGKKVVVK